MSAVAKLWRIRKRSLMGAGDLRRQTRWALRLCVLESRTHSYWGHVANIKAWKIMIEHLKRLREKREHYTQSTP